MFVLIVNIVWLLIVFASMYQIHNFPMLDAHPSIRREVLSSLFRQGMTWVIIMNLWICGG